MSVDPLSERQESEHYYYTSHDPHTAIPDWVPFARGLGPEARNLITATLVLQKSGHPPTRLELAQALGVDRRSIYRWLEEIASAGAMSTRSAGRRRLTVFHKPKGDRPISDRPISDRPISDRPISDRPISDRPISDRPITLRDSDESEHACQQSHETVIGDQAITDPTVGVGVGQHVGDSESTTTNRAPLKTALARWLKRAGMNAAREFDDPALDYATYREFVEYKRGLGWEWRQIVSTLREAPLEPIASDEPADEPVDELHLLDSTSMAVIRRFEADKTEAAARAWPQEGSK